MLAAFVVYMAHEAMRGRKCIPPWSRLEARDQFVFFTFVHAYDRWARATVWN